MSAAGLEAIGVTVRFGGLVALDDVGIAAPPGAVTGLIGPNGAGKTTLFDVCCGYRRADEGRVLLDGADISGWDAVARARAGFGRTFQRLELFWSLSVRENVELAAEATGLGEDPLAVLGLRKRGRRHRQLVQEQAAEALKRTQLEPLADRVASTLTTGQSRLLEVARCLARRPRLLLLDEPSSGLDRSETERFGTLIRSMVELDAVGVLLVENDIRLVRQVCDRVSVLDFGKLIFEGTAGEVAESAVVRSAYLGDRVVS